MSKIKFLKNEIDKLSINKYVLRVSDKAITYTNEFKIHFVVEYSKGKTSRVIFEEAGFDIDVLGIRRIDSLMSIYQVKYYLLILHICHIQILIWPICRP